MDFNQLGEKLPEVPFNKRARRSFAKALEDAQSACMDVEVVFPTIATSAWNLLMRACGEKLRDCVLKDLIYIEYLGGSAQTWTFAGMVERMSGGQVEGTGTAQVNINNSSTPNTDKVTFYNLGTHLVQGGYKPFIAIIDPQAPFVM